MTPNIQEKIQQASGMAKAAGTKAWSNLFAGTRWIAERIMLTEASIIVGIIIIAIVSAIIHWGPDEYGQYYAVASMRVSVFSEQVIDLGSPIFDKLVRANHDEGVIDDEASQLVNRRENLKRYLESKKSPFAEDDAALDAFVASKNMKMMVAISYVESTFGQHCYYHNCSGIGGTPPNLRKYDSYADWIRDFDALLERRYKDVPPEKFIGLYVQPGSPNWIYGVNKVLREFAVIEADEQATGKIEATTLQ